MLPTHTYLQVYTRNKSPSFVKVNSLFTIIIIISYDAGCVPKQYIKMQSVHCSTVKISFSVLNFISSYIINIWIYVLLGNADFVQVEAGSRF